MFNYLFRDSYNHDIEENSSFTKGKVACYLINMDRAVERLNLVRPGIEALGFPTERISAVDGRKLDQNLAIVDYDTYVQYFKMPPELGTIGCALSHEKVWRRFLKSDNEFAVVFEDDVEFNQDKLRHYIQQAVTCKNCWDLVNFELIHSGTPVRVFDEFVCYLTNVKHSGCYLINRCAARRLLEKFYPIKMPLDHYFTASWEFDIKQLGVEPRIVHQRGLPSQIKSQDSKRVRSISLLLKNAYYHVKRETINFIYNAWISCSIKKRRKLLSLINK